MRTEKITEGMLNFQENFLNHSFTVADFMQDQTKRAVSWMKFYPWSNLNSLKIMHETIDYSKEANDYWRKTMHHSLDQVKHILTKHNKP